MCTLQPPTDSVPGRAPFKPSMDAASCCMSQFHFDFLLFVSFRLPRLDDVFICRPWQICTDFCLSQDDCPARSPPNTNTILLKYFCETCAVFSMARGVYIRVGTSSFGLWLHSAQLLYGQGPKIFTWHGNLPLQFA